MNKTLVNFQLSLNPNLTGCIPPGLWRFLGVQGSFYGTQLNATVCAAERR